MESGFADSVGGGGSDDVSGVSGINGWVVVVGEVGPEQAAEKLRSTKSAPRRRVGCMVLPSVGTPKRLCFRRAVAV
jgi:hypothetical protein